jgi:hypothetical protein
VTAGVADFGGYYSINFTERCLDTPEAAGGKNCVPNM